MVSNKKPVYVTDELCIIGCNYHTTWQSNKAMRFVLSGIVGDKAILTTRTTYKKFPTPLKDLIFIKTPHNVDKARKLTGINYQLPIQTKK